MFPSIPFLSGMWEGVYEHKTLLEVGSSGAL